MAQIYKINTWYNDILKTYLMNDSKYDTILS